AMLEHVVAHEEEIPEERPEPRARVVGRDLVHRLEHRERPVQDLGRVLREEGGTRGLMDLALAAPRLELPRDHTEERRLSGPVRSHDRHLLASLDLERRAREDVALVVAEGGVPEADERAADVRRRRERKADAPRFPRQDHATPLEALGLLPLALGLRRFRVLGAEPLGEALELRDLLVELDVLRLEALPPQLALLEVAGERHGIFR